MSVFSDRLRDLRIEKEKKQSDMAEVLGVSSQSYSAYETGREPKYELLRKIADYFGVTADYLLGESDQKTPINASIGEITGLTNDAIERIKQWKMAGWSDLASEIIFDINFTDAMRQIIELFKMGLNFDEHFAMLSKGDLKKLSEGQEASPMMVPGEQMVKVCVMRVKDDFSKITDNAIKYERNKAAHNVGDEDK